MATVIRTLVGSTVNRAIQDLIEFDAWNSENMDRRQAMLGRPPCSSYLADLQLSKRLTDTKAGACDHFLKAFSQHKNAVRCTFRDGIIPKRSQSCEGQW